MSKYLQRCLDEHTCRFNDRESLEALLNFDTANRTCTAIARSTKVRCRSSISATHWSDAGKILEKLKDAEIPSGSLKNDIDCLVELTTCRRGHRGGRQAAQLAKKWLTTIATEFLAANGRTVAAKTGAALRDGEPTVDWTAPGGPASWVAFLLGDSDLPQESQGSPSVEMPTTITEGMPSGMASAVMGLARAETPDPPGLSQSLQTTPREGAVSGNESRPTRPKGVRQNQNFPFPIPAAAKRRRKADGLEPGNSEDPFTDRMEPGGRTGDVENSKEPIVADQANPASPIQDGLHRLQGTPNAASPGSVVTSAAPTPTFDKNEDGESVGATPLTGPSTLGSLGGVPDQSQKRGYVREVLSSESPSSGKRTRSRVPTMTSKHESQLLPPISSISSAAVSRQASGSSNTPEPCKEDLKFINYAKEVNEAQEVKKLEAVMREGALGRTNSSGYLYIFKCTRHEHLKIGFAKGKKWEKEPAHPPDHPPFRSPAGPSDEGIFLDDALGDPALRGHPAVHRIKAWKTCGHTIMILHTVYMPDAVAKMEALVHRHLIKQRRKESEKCERCKVSHDEWFEITLPAAKKAIESWKTLCSTRPFNSGGYLRPFWQRLLRPDKKGTKAPKGTNGNLDAWLEGMTRRIDEEKVERQAPVVVIETLTLEVTVRVLREGERLIVEVPAQKLQIFDLDVIEDHL